MIQIRIRTSIVLRTTLVVLLVALLVGLAALVLAGRIARRWEAAQQHETLEALLDVVGPSASAACYVEDKALADQVVAGLIRTPAVHGAVLRSGATVLAQARRSGTLPAQAPPGIARGLTSPFTAEAAIGELALTPDPWEIERRAARTALLLRTFLLGFVVALGAILAFTVNKVIIQPIRALSNRLHRLDADAGGRLQVPPGHEGDEIGRLVADVNALVQRMVNAIWKEQELYQRLLADKRKGQAVLGEAGTGIFVVRADGALEAWTAAFLWRLGLQEAPPPPGARFSPLFKGGAAEAERCLAQCLATGAQASVTLRMRDDQSEEGHRWLHLTLEPIGPDWFQGLLDDVTSYLDGPAAAGRPEVRDAGTGALNRLGLEYALAERFAAGARGMGIVMVGLDAAQKGGAPVDLGRADGLLREAVRRMTGALRRWDIIGHLEGGEFLLVLDLLEDSEAALRLARKLAEALAAPFRMDDGQFVTLEASIGITLRKAGEEPSRQTLLRRADQALAEARRAGGNCCRLRLT